MDRPSPGTSRIIRTEAVLDRLIELMRATDVRDNECIPYRLICEALKTAPAVGPFDDFVDEEALTALLHCTRPTLRGYVEQGLPFIPLGVRKWYSLASVQKWMKSLERSAEPRRRGRPANRPPVQGRTSENDRLGGDGHSLRCL